jgi:hypothetical protein
MSYWSFLKATMKYVMLTAVALGVILAILALFVGHAEFDITIELASDDALTLLLGAPIVLGILALVMSPLSWLMYRVGSRGRNAVTGVDDTA